MNRWLHLLERLFETGADRAETVIGPRPTVVGPRPSATVIPPPRFAWDEKRWRSLREGTSTHYLGAYRVQDRRRHTWRSFDGRIVVEGGEIVAYCADPPPEIKSHHKGPCFMLVRPPWFRVHWRRAPASVDEAMLYVEQLLDECLNERRN